MAGRGRTKRGPFRVLAPGGETGPGVGPVNGADRLLLVEDDPGLRQAILSALVQGGYSAIAVPDGIQAAQRLRSEMFDLILLDLGLPFVNGWEILAQLEAQPLPSVIVISARGSEG